MIKEFRLPDLGEGLTESEIVSWHVNVGDTVELNQIIADVETAKAVVELPSPFAGTVAELHEKPGTTVAVGAPIVSFEIDADDDANDAGDGGSAADGGRQAGTGDGGPKRQAVLVGYGAEVEKTGRPQRRRRSAGSTATSPETAVSTASAVPSVAVSPEPPVEPTSAPDTNNAGAGTPGTGERPRSTPPVRKMAKDLGVDLTRIHGTGAQGLITRDDVQAHVGAPADGAAHAMDSAPASGAARTASGERETRSPIRGMRKHTAEAMVASAFTAPHATEFLTIDVTPTMELLATLKGMRSFAESRLTPLTIVAKALLIAVGRNRSVNTRWDETTAEIVQYNYVNLGIAAATPRGLMVPNIKDADRLSLLELAGALSDLTHTARAGKTSPPDLTGGTISITNVGVFGIDAGTPILNPGEAAILAVGAVRRTPWEYQGEVALRQVMTLSLSFDHRLVDGEQGSKFLADIGRILAEPGMVLAMI